MSPDSERVGRHFVYRCYDQHDQLLYVGCTDDVESRMYHHLAVCNIGKVPNFYLKRDMVRYEVESFADRTAARAGERSAIAAEAPLLNKQHNKKRVKKVGHVYHLVAPVHPLTASAFPEAPHLSSEVAA